jgi:hypothetical protein
MAARNSTGASRATRALSRPELPTKPIAILCGELQSRQFTDGVYALADAIREFEVESTCASIDYDEHRATAALAQRIMPLIEQGGETRAGAVAAIANWLVIEIVSGCCPDPSNWKPLEAHPAYDGGDTAEPHPLASFFDVAGTPVSVTPDLVSLKWADGDNDTISVEVVRSIGKPISRRRFDAMRAASTA